MNDTLEEHNHREKRQHSKSDLYQIMSHNTMILFKAVKRTKKQITLCSLFLKDINFYSYNLPVPAL